MSAIRPGHFFRRTATLRHNGKGWIALPGLVYCAEVVFRGQIRAKLAVQPGADKFQYRRWWFNPCRDKMWAAGQVDGQRCRNYGDPVKEIEHDVPTKA